MELFLLAQGFMIGFALAIPLGPIGALCIQRTITYGFLYGFISGLGVATADAIYGFAGTWGAGYAADFLAQSTIYLKVVGGIVLMAFGVRMLVSASNIATGNECKPGLFGAYVSIMVLTLANPVTLLAFLAFFSSISDIHVHGIQIMTVVVGTFTGSLLWWMILTGGVSFFRSIVTPPLLAWLMRIAGVAICIFGSSVLVQSIVILLGRISL
jgi:threonine/homoserine/homoserine lactone efflux protein